MPGKRRTLRARIAITIVPCVVSVGAFIAGGETAHAGSLPSPTPHQIRCIADRNVYGLSNDRPPTKAEIAKVVQTASDCAFQAPRGYAEQLYEDRTGKPAPHVDPAASSLIYLTNAQLKCIADARLGGIDPNVVPSDYEVGRTIEMAAQCGVAAPASYLERVAPAKKSEPTKKSAPAKKSPKKPAAKARK